MLRLDVITVSSTEDVQLTDVAKPSLPADGPLPVRINDVLHVDQGHQDGPVGVIGQPPRLTNFGQICPLISLAQAF